MELLPGTIRQALGPNVPRELASLMAAYNGAPYREFAYQGCMRATCVEIGLLEPLAVTRNGWIYAQLTSESTASDPLRFLIKGRIVNRRFQIVARTAGHPANAFVGAQLRVDTTRDCIIVYTANARSLNLIQFYGSSSRTTTRRVDVSKPNNGTLLLSATGSAMMQVHHKV